MKWSFPGQLPPAPAAASLPAKLSLQDAGWLPLWVHCADTAGMASYLLEKWLPTGARRVLEEAIGQSDLEQVVFAAAMLHDLAKASALFATNITADCPALRERMIAAGLQPLSDGDVTQQKGYTFRHAAAGEMLLIMAGAPLTFAEVIGAHHGQPWPEGEEAQSIWNESGSWPDPRAISLWGRREQKPAWRQAQRECLTWMLKASGLDSAENLPELTQPAAMILTGLVIMADWIASNESYFPLIPLDAESPNNMQNRLAQGWNKLDLPPAWSMPETDDWDGLAEEQFGFAPNGVQRAMMQAVQESKQPGLMILEAPMGLGKTEAALLTADLLSARGTGGIFFGLPTQATANAIFSRIADWGEKQPQSNQISIRLAHGMADLNEKYRALMAGQGASTVEDDAGNERLVVHEWFRGRKQALLADFVVGTVDQVLMAALRQKHLMLRHLGLCGKAVIIDECHAYDAYMNQYLEEALRWLGRYHTPVIMLSATLPAQRRADFIAAYLNRPQTEHAKQRLRTEAWYSGMAYPALTWTDGNRVRQQLLPYDGPERKVTITKLQHGDDLESQAEAAAKLLRDALEDGGCAAVVVNTVRRAQAFAETLRQVLPEPEYKVLLLHSRFVMPDRLKNEGELLRRMGKQSDDKQRNRVVVVGTQVIEQSLDFDADVMISDLCPMDLLLQRIGRLHRHPRHDSIRPERLQESRCYVMCAAGRADSGAKAVYGEYLLMRTRALLPETVSLPGDIPVLVNNVYDPDYPLAEVPEGYEAAKAEDENKWKELERSARAFRIQDPDQDFEKLLEDEIPPDDDHARAQVRASDISMDVLLLTQPSAGRIGLLPWLSNKERWDTLHCPSSSEARQILAQRISLPAGLVRSLAGSMTWEGLEDALAPPETWQSSTWLRNAHILMLDENCQAKLSEWILTYDQQTGLQYRKERDADG